MTVPQGGWTFVRPRTRNGWGVRPYIAHGRRQLRIGWMWRRRGWEPWRWHFHWIEFGWYL